MDMDVLAYAHGYVRDSTRVEFAHATRRDGIDRIIEGLRIAGTPEGVKLELQRARRREPLTRAREGLEFDAQVRGRGGERYSADGFWKSKFHMMYCQSCSTERVSPNGYSILAMNTTSSRGNMNCTISRSGSPLLLVRCSLA